MPDPAEEFALALAYLRAGRLAEAEPIFQRLIQSERAPIEALGYLGGIRMAQGRFAEAEWYFQQVLRERPGAVEIHNDLGVTLAQQGRLPQAGAAFRRATELRPDYAEAYNNLGIVLAQQGQLFEAVRCYRRALAIKADYAEAESNLGLALGTLGQLPEAIASQCRALELRPDFAGAQNNLQAARAAQAKLHQDWLAFRSASWNAADEATAYNDLGLALAAQGNGSEAVASYQAALRLRPDFPEAYNNLGVAFKDRGNTEEAEASFRQALALNPEFVEAHNNLGTLLESVGKLEEARAAYGEALRRRPDLAEAHNNVAVVLNKQGKTAEALAHYRRALALKPDYADALSNLGTLLTDQGEHAEGLACYERALQLNPDYAEAHLHRAQAWLRQGDFARGWPEFEWRWRWRQFPPRPFPQPLWSGEALYGRSILLHAEQGLGDTLQFIRYAPLVKARGGQVLVECPEVLAGLLATCPGIDQVVVQGSALPPFAVHAPLVSLPGIFGTTLKTIPAQVPYLFADPERVAHWRPQLPSAPGRRIGIAWQGNPRHTNDLHRSVPLSAFAPLAALEGVQLVSLQKGPGTEQLTAAAGAAPFPITDLGSRFETFQDTAAVLTQLDLVITVDSAVAHCAGALGVPVWVLLPVASDWRWLMERTESPWYPSMRLFRQRTLGAWDEVFERVAQEVPRWLRQEDSPQVEALAQQAAAYLAGRQFEEAAAVYRQLVRLRPNQAAVHSDLGIALAQLGNLSEAEACFREAVRLDPAYAEGYNNLGIVRAKQDQLEEALVEYRKSLALKSDNPQAYYNLANALRDLGRSEEALANYEQAARLRPDYAEALTNRAMTLLLLGQFKGGWPGYEWRWFCPEFTPRPFLQPQWDGSSLAGRTILLHAEQGLGDTLQFIRYAPLVKQRGGSVIVEAPWTLLPLLAGTPGIDHLVAYGSPLPAFDTHTPLLSLPGIFGTTLANLPADVPYLFPSPELRLAWREELGAVDAFKIGIFWRGDPRHRRDRQRSIPLAQFAPLAELPGVQLYSLQHGIGAEELAQRESPGSILDVGSRFRHFGDTAAVLQNLDLVISVDSAVAHAAGALGLPVWLLLPFAPDWRWLRERDDSPWYPTMRLFRQQQRGDWEAVMGRVARALQQRLADRTGTPPARSALGAVRETVQPPGGGGDRA